MSADLETYALLADHLNAETRPYLRVRALIDAEDDPEAFVAALRDRLARALRADAAGFLAWAQAKKSELGIATLNTAAWLALERGLWEPAATLAREVVARDHHDLLAQRLTDAAEAQSTTLELEVDHWLATRTCRAPWRQIETRANGMVHFCCSAWQPVAIGALDKGQSAFWNSDRARAIRASVREGRFAHCSRWHCPEIADRRLPPKDTAVAATAEDPLAAAKGPERVILSHDRSCNISCPSCRTDLITLNHAASERLDRLFDERLMPLVADATDVKVTGSGDPFGSRHFRNVLKKLTQDPPQKRIQLHTNGLLANARAWDELNLHGNVRSVWVSVDAAEAETYSELRRGGDFATLLESLRFLGSLRRSGDLPLFRLDFVVQTRNYQEMGAFVDLAREVGADGVYFLRLRNWGHFPAETFRQMDVCSADHPEHSQLLAHLADPRLAGEGIELGSMSELVSRARLAAE